MPAPLDTVSLPAYSSPWSLPPATRLCAATATKTVALGIATKGAALSLPTGAFGSCDLLVCSAVKRCQVCDSAAAVSVVL
jgi:hypothetical protein